MTAFDKSWTFLKNGASYPDRLPGESKKYPMFDSFMRPVDEQGNLIPAPYKHEVDHSKNMNLVPSETSPSGYARKPIDNSWMLEMAEELKQSGDGEIEPPEPDNRVSEGPDWRDER
jgi:hypothetical protein